MFAAANLILKVKFLGGAPQETAAQLPRRSSWKFDKFCQIAQPPAAAPGRTKSAALTQLPFAAPPRPFTAARGRGTRTFVRPVSHP